MFAGVPDMPLVIKASTRQFIKKKCTDLIEVLKNGDVKQFLANVPILCPQKTPDK